MSTVLHQFSLGTRHAYQSLRVSYDKEERELTAGAKVNLENLGVF